jgi:hypothetical protein
MCCAIGNTTGTKQTPADTMVADSRSEKIKIE